MTADSRQVELVALRSQVEELKNRVGDAEKDFTATQARLAQERRRIRECDPRSHRVLAAGSRI